MGYLFLTGMPRSGTSLLAFLLRYIDNLNVHTHTELHPIDVSLRSVPNKLTAFKQPYGYFEDFPPSYTYDDLLKKGYKIISLIRDPRDVLVSRHAVDRSFYWVKPIILKRVAKEHLKHINTKKVLSLRYEDLVDDPEKTMKLIAKFVDGCYSGEFVDFYKNIGPSPMTRALNGPRPIDKKRIGVWKQEEHKDRIKKVLQDKELVKLIGELGYE